MLAFLGTGVRDLVRLAGRASSSVAGAGVVARASASPGAAAAAAAAAAAIASAAPTLGAEYIGDASRHDGRGQGTGAAGVDSTPTASPDPAVAALSATGTLTPNGTPSATTSSAPAAASPAAESATTTASGTVSATATASVSASAAPPAAASASAAPPAARVSAFTPSLMVPTGYRVVRKYRHDTRCYTQGLLWREDVVSRTSSLYESCGLTGQSSVRRVTVTPAGADGAGGDPNDAAHRSPPPSRDKDGDGDGGDATAPSAPPSPAALEYGAYTMTGETPLAAPYFGEGICVVGPHLFQLTWQHQTGFTYDADSLARVGSAAGWRYTTTQRRDRYNEGWGMTTGDGLATVIVSDGTEDLITWTTSSLVAGGPAKEVSRVSVRDAVPADRWRPTGNGAPAIGGPLPLLNEIEYAHGWVIANIWQSDFIAFIHAGTGAVAAYMDMSPLRTGVGEVLNGLAYSMRLGPRDTDPWGDAVWGGRLWVTGKWWDTMYELELTGLVDAAPVVQRRQRQLEKKRAKKAGTAAGGKRGAAP